jgi:hypothetical protein
MYKETGPTIDAGFSRVFKGFQAFSRVFKG